MFIKISNRKVVWIQYSVTRVQVISVKKIAYIK